MSNFKLIIFLLTDYIPFQPIHKEFTIGGNMKKLHISEENKIIFGVCGGLAESLGIKANIIRGIFIVSLLLGLSGVWIYLILLVILPKGGREEKIIDVEVEPQKEHKIYRCWKNRMIAGVCCGIAKYLNWDISLLRLAFVVMSFVGGVGIILYLIFWFLFPNEE